MKQMIMKITMEETKKSIKINQGLQKVLNYLDYFIDSDFFQNEIKALREKYKIPPDGFIKCDYDKISEHDIFYVPPEWCFVKNKQCIKKLNIDIKKIAKKLPLKNHYLHLIIKVYLFHNFVIKNKESFLSSENLCKVINERERFFEYYGADPEFYLECIKNENLTYPISIRLSPYASQRDILDFIKNNFFLIKSSQDKYIKQKSKFSRIKTKDYRKQERNRFIYEHRNLPRKKIMKLVADKFGYDDVIDYGHIGKIISVEKKKRKEV